MLLLLFLLAAPPSPTPAPTGKRASVPSFPALQAEVARLKAELAPCRGRGKFANSPAKAEAIAALRAVRSALEGGANLELFRKYQIESRIKIDALPDTPDNKIIREISDIYADALTFTIMRLTGTISEGPLQYLRQKYSEDAAISAMLSVIKATHNPYENEFNQIPANTVSNLPIIKAKERFADLK